MLGQLLNINHIDKMQVLMREHYPHLPFSSDLVPCSYHFLVQLKRLYVVAGWPLRMKLRKLCRYGLENSLKGFPMEWCKKCISQQGNYEKSYDHYNLLLTVTGISVYFFVLFRILINHFFFMGLISFHCSAAWVQCLRFSVNENIRKESCLLKGLIEEVHSLG